MYGPIRLSSIAAKLVVGGAALALLPLAGIGTAAADPVADGTLLAKVTSANGSYVEKVESKGPQDLIIYVHSGSMNRTFPVEVQRPHDTSVPRPTLYLLNGLDAGVGDASWQARTDAFDFLSDKNINVVSPIGGIASYYADWRNPDPALGVNKWKTFLTAELPPIIDAALGTNGKNSIAGLSMSGTSVLSLAQSEPTLYESVAAYSGCAQIADPLGQQFLKLTVERGGGNYENMYGPPNDPMWAANDPLINAEKLRGIDLYISNGNGLPGAHETLTDPHLLVQNGNAPASLANQVIVGGVIEAVVNYCSHNLENKLNQLGIPATYSFPPSGTHSWGYWEDELKRSWPVLSGRLGI
ncbi:alpha/beta hydrolase [Antrihabitans sp. NCIMB 15449]|uniref:Alpha/beta hydrolase n=1 Tax=Antrihabitans spumae TaxID=3373370 RepID=A0ABW7JGA3_9NOCA